MRLIPGTTLRLRVRLRLRSIAIASAALALFALTACDDGTGSGSAGEPCSSKSFRCASPACSARPLNPGCDDVAPTGGRCPLDHAHCFDPSTSPGFCDGSTVTSSHGQVCAKRKDTAPMDCPATTSQLATYCISSTIMRCADIDSSAAYCRNGYECIPFNCEDGGPPPQQDMSMPRD